MNGVVLNTQMKPFDNVELRRAFAAAIDWREVTSVRPELTVATQMVPTAVPTHDPSFTGQKFDQNLALTHMKNAGYPYDPVTKKGGYPEPVRFVGPADSSITDLVAPMVEQAVARVGIRMELVQVSYPAYLAEVSRDFAESLAEDPTTADLRVYVHDHGTGPFAAATGKIKNVYLARSAA